MDELATIEKRLRELIAQIPDAHMRLALLREVERLIAIAQEP